MFAFNRQEGFFIRDFTVVYNKLIKKADVLIEHFKIRKKSTELILISLFCLLIGHLLNPNNLPLSFLGFVIISIIVYRSTLLNNDIFSFVIVIYFCSLFRYWSGHGGAFNYISLFVIIPYLFRFRRLPNEYKIRSWTLIFFLIILYISSLLGWLFNYVGSPDHLFLSVLSFSGLILLFYVSCNLVITEERIKVFLQVNLFLAVYSLVASLNKYTGIITFDTPMMPIYGTIQAGYFESGGIIGSSPPYGEFSMLIFVFFITVALLGKGNLIKNNWLYFGAVISILNVFFSISRSVFLSSILGLVIVLIFQSYFVRIGNTVKNIFLLFIFGFLVLTLVESFGLGYVFERLESAEGYKVEDNASLYENILDGSAFERKETFDISYDKYYSKSNWIIGYGWGLSDDNRNAFFLDVNEKITSVHSQFWAILFLFGWCGLVIYYFLYFKAIWGSWSAVKTNINGMYYNRILAFYFVVAHILFFINEIKIDSIYLPGYFAVTMILLGISYSNLATLKYKI